MSSHDLPMGVFGINCRTGRVLLLLVMIGNVTQIKTQGDKLLNETTNELYLTLKPRFTLEKNRTVEDPSNEKLREQLETLVGPLPEPGLPDHKGIYSIFLQAYHFNIYGTILWDRGSEWYKYWLAWMTDIRKAQWDWEQVDRVFNNCKTSIDEYEKFMKDVSKNSNQQELEKHNIHLTTCENNLNEMFTTDAIEILEYNLRRSHVRAIHLTAQAFSLAFNLFYVQFNAKYISLIEEYSAHMISPFPKLHHEMYEFNEVLRELLGEFESLVGSIDENSSYGKLVSSAYRNITEKLNSSFPYNVLYVPDQMEADIRYEKLDRFFGGIGNHIYVYFEDTKKIKLNIKALGGRKLSVTLLDDYHFVAPSGLDNLNLATYKEVEDIIEDYFNETIRIYNQDLMVEPLRSDDSRKDDFVNWDGKWNWEIEGTDKRNLLHNMILGHNLLKGVLEEVKCYLNKTYDRKAREQMLEQHNSYDWTKAKLYMDRSNTLFGPCSVKNEMDLVGNCNEKNHEICVPVYTHAKQDPESEIAGGLSLLTPSWVYRMEDGVCKGKRTYITHFRICQCGFRQDCGSDFGEGVKINCQFVVNDYVRRQCRGGSGYPCRTHPLAPGKHHQSCATGYCDMEENFCENFHYHIFE